MQKSTNLYSYSSFLSGLNGRFGQLIPETKERLGDLTDISDAGGRTAKWVVALLMLGAAWVVQHSVPELARFYRSLLQSTAGIGYIVLCKALFIAYGSVFVWRLYLVARYRPAPACTDAELLTCTVIVPAYNEGRQVLHTLRSVVRSDMPFDKLQIIAVDDGSKDDTWRWIEKAARCFPSRITAIRMPQNGGKRKALYEGFLRSTGEIIVTIDSDSLIEPHTIRRLISPFSHDARVGGVAGCVRVLNLHQGLIPRLLDVAFAFTFDFHRASQSQADTVVCTPGALSAYRKKPLMDNLAAWLNQTFMGRHSTIGEDRAMTNFILKDGYSVKFQSDAIVYTNVPTRYKQLCKMLLRWARSNVRETLFMATYVFQNFRAFSRLGARLNFMTCLLDTAIPRLPLVVAVLCLFGRPDLWAVKLLIGGLTAAAVQGVFYYLRRRSFDALWAFPYSIFSALALSWIAPYAILTAANGSWMTRELFQTDRPHPKKNRDDARTVAAA